MVGGKAVLSKRVVVDYDSDDGRIITLKQQGFSDEYVSQKLIQEGRIRYQAKTVTSRWLRLRKALEAAENERMDDELSDWHEDDVSTCSRCLTSEYDVLTTSGCETSTEHQGSRR